MVRSCVKHIKSSQSSLKSNQIDISARQKKTSIKGVVGEYEAIARLTKQGFYVAKSCDPACPFDIVIVDKDGKIQLLDIKTITYRKTNKGKSLKDKPKGSYKICRSPTREQKRLGIKLIMVDYENKPLNISHLCANANENSCLFNFIAVAAGVFAYTELTARLVSLETSMRII